MSRNWDVTIEEQNKPAFYEQDSGATTIMTLANFPDEVLPLLQMESLITYEAMIYFRCELLVELGCYDGRALEIARLLNTRYLGIDLNPRAIQLLRIRIEREGMTDRADTIIGDVLVHTTRGQTLIDSRTLCLLPFNLLGNFRDPTPLLKQLAMLNVTAVICVFSNSSEATRVRQDYYLRCGVQQLERHPLEDGMVFTGARGFYSRSYTRESFHALLAQCGLTIVRASESLLAYCATVKLDTKYSEVGCE
ncbi:class I SAM-dependent methyltransferase [Serratia fonticola]|uniref:class I SAM-dependent methyltransferase n=1 Tax=Serratia fonticola TaxID=47917 RepID=UPI001AE1ADF6|nr:class I SAM-dependent methyltransferase [Serratia fonticola]MBP1035092.1 class I SAM-dependent methyltransferase [Serratia fonticola]